MKEILKVENLSTHFFTDAGVVKAVDGNSFSINAGETLGVVGESGCGKSITAMSILNLIEKPGRIVSGSIKFKGEELVGTTDKRIREIRGNEISMIFQEPMTSLNPVFKVGDQISEALILHRNLSKDEARKKAIEMIDLVGMPRPKEVVDNYPHQLSGGMRQRVMIAMALACNPKLLIADEPTTALDVTIQAQILSLMKNLQKETQTAIMIITHDLGVVAQLADYIIVMYSGKIVEKAPVEDLFGDPKHPYTVGLLSSIPKADIDEDRLSTIEGAVPNPLELPKGCYFEPRCNKSMDICREKQPGMYKLDDRRHVSCFLYENEKGAE